MISLSIDLRFNWFGCQSMCESNDFGCHLIWDSSELVVNWFELQVIWLSTDVCFKWFWLSVDLSLKGGGCQLIWASSDLVVNWFEIQGNLVVNRCVVWWILFVSWFEIQVSWLSIDLRFTWFGCQSVWDSKLFCETSFKNEALKFKNERFCETSFKNEALKIKNEAFLRDFLQKWSFEAQKRSFCARLLSKMKLWRSKTKHFCETSFKNEASKLKNETCLRDFLQKWHVDQTRDLRIPIRFRDFQVDASKVLRLPRRSWAEAYEVL